MSRTHRHSTGAFPTAPIVAMLLAFVIVVGAVVVGIGMLVSAPDEPGGADVATPPLVPAAVEVPSIGARSSSMVGLGRDQAGGWAIPPIDDPGQASWYSDGPAPGQPGGAVILGHINGCSALIPGSDPPRCTPDAARLPGVFERLDQVRAGDTATVTGQDGRTVTFTATRDAETVPKDRFPAADVLARSPLRELRLISCGGAYDPANRRYLSNVIVTLVAS